MTTNKSTVTYAILTNEVYQKLASSFPILVNRETTEIMSGYQLGVQAVLQKLREGFVIEQR
jgi:hypothetical protein